MAKHIKKSVIIQQIKSLYFFLYHMFWHKYIFILYCSSRDWFIVALCTDNR